MKRLVSLVLIFLSIINTFTLPCSAQEAKKKNIFLTLGDKLPAATAIALTYPECRNDIIVRGNVNENVYKNLSKVFNNVYKQNEFNKSSAKFYDNIFSWDNEPTAFWPTFGKETKHFHMDEGSTAYCELQCLWLHKLHLENTLNKIFCMYPEHLTDSFKSIPTEVISREKYLEAIKILYDPQPIKNEIIYCLDPPNIFNARQTMDIIRAIKNYDSVAVKCHPADLRKYLWPGNFTVLDKTTPFESFYYGFNGIFISNLSSCLHTAKFMSPGSTVICTVYLSNYNYPQEYEKYIEMLKQIGVLFPKTFDELDDMIIEKLMA